jgi:hypothetical protein
MMTLFCWLKRREWLWSRATARHTRKAKHRTPMFYRRLCLEELETRQLLSAANPLSPVSAIGPNAGPSQTSVISESTTGNDVNLSIASLAGQQSFIFVNQVTNTITVQDTQSGQSFNLPYTAGLRDHEDFVMADLTGDGISDVIVANGNANNILVYLGLPNGQFAPPQAFSVGADAVNLAVGDLNGDGIPDVVVADKQSNDISILFGRGQGSDWTLTSGPTLPVGLAPVSIAIADVYNNGIPDILVANSASNNVYLLRGEGGGNFDATNPVIFQTGNDPVQVLVADFSGDGGLDLVAVNAGSSDVTFFADFGPGQTVSTGGVAPVGALLVDFDSDADTDLIVAHDNGNFTLLTADSNGLQITQEFASGLQNVSDTALGSTSSGAVQIYATTDGISAAFLVTLVVDASPGPSTPSTPTDALDLAHSQVTEFSAAGGNDMEIVVAVVLRSEYSSEFAVPSQAALPSSQLGNREPEEAEGLMLIDVYGGNDTGTLDRNSVITGASEAPVQRFLDRPTNAQELPIPFSSPLDLFDVRPQAPMGSWQDVVEKIGGQMVGWTKMAYLPNLLDGALAPEPSVPVLPTPTDAPVADQTGAILERHDARADATPRLQSGSAHAAVFFLAAALVPIKSPRRQRRQEPVANTKRIRSSKGEPHAGS